MTIVDFSATPSDNHIGAENTQLDKATGHISGLFDNVYSSIENSVVHFIKNKMTESPKKNQNNQKAAIHFFKTRRHSYHGKLQK